MWKQWIWDSTINNPQYPSIFYSNNNKHTGVFPTGKHPYVVDGNQSWSAQFLRQFTQS